MSCKSAVLKSLVLRRLLIVSDSFLRSRSMSSAYFIVGGGGAMCRGLCCTMLELVAALGPFPLPFPLIQPCSHLHMDDRGGPAFWWCGDAFVHQLQDAASRPPPIVLTLRCFCGEGGAIWRLPAEWLRTSDCLVTPLEPGGRLLRFTKHEKRQTD